MFRTTILLTVIAIGSAQAADLMVNDLRLNYMPIMGQSFKMTGRLVDQAPSDPAFTAVDGNQSVTRDSESHTRIGLGFYRTFRELELNKGSFMWGVEVSKDQTESGQYNIHLDGDGTMVDGFLGIAWAFAPWWHIEEGLLLGVGQTKWDFKVERWFNNSDWTDTYTSTAYEYGFRVGSYFTVWDHLDIGLDGRYMVMRSKAKFTGNGLTAGGATETSSYEPTIQIDGLGVTLSAGYRF